jgi:hypothetical protein
MRANDPTLQNTGRKAAKSESKFDFFRTTVSISRNDAKDGAAVVSCRDAEGSELAISYGVTSNTAPASTDPP